MTVQEIFNTKAVQEIETEILNLQLPRFIVFGHFPT